MFRRRKHIALVASFAWFIPEGPVLASEQAKLADLLQLVRLLEAPRGYDDYYRGVAETPPRSLTSMSIAEVLHWQDTIDARSPSEAAGGYMIMEDTLRQLHVEAGIAGTAPFDQATQDRLGEHLARDAGFGAFARDEITPVQFGDQLASIWAAFPLLSGPLRGQSRYRGLAGNRALIGPDQFEHILRNLGSIDIAGEVGLVVPSDKGQRGERKRAAAREGFAPSRIVRWTTDPFYQE